MAAHRYWRLYVTAKGVGGGSLIISGVEMRVAADEPNIALTGNGTAFASSEFGGFEASKAFDNNNTTSWYPPSDLPQSVGWDFGGGNEQDIQYVTIVNSNNSADSHVVIGVLEWSDNGSTWVSSILTSPNSTVALVRTTFGPPNSIDAAFSLPSMTLGAGTGAQASFALSPISLSGDFGLSAGVQLPTLTLKTNFGAGVDITLPALTVYARGSDSTGRNSLKITLPPLALAAHFGGVASVQIPPLAVDADATGTALVTVDITLPSLEINAGGTGSPYIVSTSFALPMPELVAHFGGEGRINLPLMEFEASITAGGLLTAEITLPMISLESSATAESYGAIVITLPMLVPVVGITADISLPMIRLDARIEAVVSVTYEAYALNLKHTSETPDELTRFTNYPFDKIIRYQNSYYGVNSTGLYLLEGTTDFADPTPTAIPYSVRTKLTDFGTDQMKTPEAAVFGGRLGPGATVTVYTGETEDDVYAYTTPRGQDVQNYRQKFGKGLKARYYAFGIQGDGAMSIDTVSFDLATLKRRI